MVVGKNTASFKRAAVAAGAPLPPLPKLRVRRPNRDEANPCVAVMSSVLACWASSGYTSQGCVAVEQQLRTCMDARKATTAKKSTINHTLSRFYPQIIGPQKRK